MVQLSLVLFRDVLVKLRGVSFSVGAVKSGTVERRFGEALFRNDFAECSEVMVKHS